MPTKPPTLQSLFTNKPSRDDRRPSAAKRGYDRRHQRWRLMVLARDPLCVEHQKHGELVSATVADHIVSLREWEESPTAAAHKLEIILSERGKSWELLDAWSLDNAQGLCSSCHARKSIREDGAFRR